MPPDPASHAEGTLPGGADEFYKARSPSLGPRQEEAALSGKLSYLTTPVLGDESRLLQWWEKWLPLYCLTMPAAL